MEFVLIAVVSLLASGLTLFSGFGLGTILMPAFAIFFPIETAIALTAIVHFLNNIFKLFLLGKFADRSTILKFGIPAILAAFIGAYILIQLSDSQPIYKYQMFQNSFEISLIKLIIALIMTFFAVFELIPKYQKLAFDKKYLPVGGVLSGFFGGISGHQGALRSAFLIKAGLTKESFIATGVVIAVLIDLTRMAVYSSHFNSIIIQNNIYLLGVAVISAFTGAFLGKQLLNKITYKTIQILVGILLILIAILLALGII